MRAGSHEIYGRRRSRNIGLGLVLGAFVLLTFAVTIVTLSEGVAMQGYAHSADTLPSAPAAESH